MTMNASEANYDLVLTGAQICDPATGLDRICDLAVTGDRIAAVGSGLASRARQVIELDGKLATAGWIDLHVHVFEWMTTFGLPPDDAGVHSGVTTAVDQGGTGAYTIAAFKHYIAERALTDIRCFPSINSAGTLRGRPTARAQASGLRPPGGTVARSVQHQLRRAALCALSPSQALSTGSPQFVHITCCCESGELDFLGREWTRLCFAWLRAAGAACSRRRSMACSMIERS